MKNYTITVNGKVYEVTVEEGFSGQTQNAAAPVSAPAAPSSAPKAPAAPAPQAAAAGAVTVSAPMPGKILDVRVSAGQAVKRGDVLMILEAMKMENEIVSPQDGTVASIQVSVGSAVEAGDTLASLN
ncbi:biotin/lipoyl-containing protein [Frisingicoccus sp.]|uniref:biotin/lipoyl-containing protein n=1 Tax=Frisingicoccus sp. TaxID=1918627 RepID=UPI003AB4EE33